MKQIRLNFEEAFELTSYCLLLFPHFGDGGACGVYVVFEGDTCVVKAGELLRSGSEEEHAAVADGASGAEFAHASSSPSGRLSIGCHLDSLAFAMRGPFCTDYRCVCTMPSTATPQDGAAVFKRDFRRGGSVESTRLTSLLPVVMPICSPSMKIHRGRVAGLPVREV